MHTEGLRIKAFLIRALEVLRIKALCTKLSPVNHLVDGILVQKGSNLKKESYCCTEP